MDTPESKATSVSATQELRALLEIKQINTMLTLKVPLCMILTHLISYSRQLLIPTMMIISYLII
jgi:hypothetical protein